jgi:hypothetical protein
MDSDAAVETAGVDVGRSGGCRLIELEACSLWETQDDMQRGMLLVAAEETRDLRRDDTNLKHFFTEFQLVQLSTGSLLDLGMQAPVGQRP